MNCTRSKRDDSRMSDSNSSVILQCMSCLHVFGSALSLAEHKRQSQDCQTEEEAVLCGEAEKVEWADIKCEIKEEEEEEIAEEEKEDFCCCEKSPVKVPVKTTAQSEALQLLKTDLPHPNREEREARVNDIVQSTDLTNDQVNEHFPLCSVGGKSFKGKEALKIHEKTHLPKDSEFKKPKRPCPYCRVKQTKLMRHLLQKHYDEDDVIALKAANGTEKKAISRAIRKRGIFLENQRQYLEAKEPVYQAMRRGKDKKYCPGCDGFYNRSSFGRHEVKCKGITSLDPSALKITQKYQNQLKAKQAVSRSKKTRANDKDCFYLCSVCGESFKGTSAVKNHEKTHLSGDGEEDGVDSLEEIPEEKRFQWSTADTDLVLKEFEEYITGASEICLPGKQDLLRFRQRHQLKCTWMQIRSKIMNESSKTRRKSQIECPNSSEMAIGKESESEMSSEILIDEGAMKNRRVLSSKVPKGLNHSARMKWSKENTELICREFEEYITAPKGMRLPRKSEVINFLQRYPMECSHVQIRTKIMNELKTARMKAKRTSRIANAQARLVQREEGGSLSEQDASNLPNDEGAMKNRRVLSSKVPKGLNHSARMKWSKENTELICREFEEYITAPKGMRLPRKSEVINFLQRHPMECSHVQIRTKIMNELKTARMKAKGTSRSANAQARLVQREEGGSLSEQDFLPGDISSAENGEVRKEKTSSAESQ
ncbi:hypothetical protein CAPTEDRAFT_191312 [Capitella teleta]|uniref:C2H2-type domain-containing protein n=1 Tax=Capitella teleta TaxID=283909 RepID=R7U6W3_CAPTE|nr:hypothetical protein CAPTEDRAFT_191312 [Capitella teleta]|eukprot:ELU01886.1 hypothetical protein CAPTEDRAFT_191312 [Capitella teleta]